MKLDEETLIHEVTIEIIRHIRLFTCMLVMLRYYLTFDRADVSLLLAIIEN